MLTTNKPDMHVWIMFRLQTDYCLINTCLTDITENDAWCDWNVTLWIFPKPISIYISQYYTCIKHAQIDSVKNHNMPSLCCTISCIFMHLKYHIWNVILPCMYQLPDVYLWNRKTASQIASLPSRLQFNLPWQFVSQNK